MSYWLVLSIAVLSAACSTLPKGYPRTESTAFPDYVETGERFMSGFIMLLPVEHPL